MKRLILCALASFSTAYAMPPDTTVSCSTRLVQPEFEFESIIPETRRGRGDHITEMFESSSAPTEMTGQGLAVTVTPFAFTSQYGTYICRKLTYRESAARITNILFQAQVGEGVTLSELKNDLAPVLGEVKDSDLKNILVRLEFGPKAASDYRSLESCNQTPDYDKFVRDLAYDLVRFEETEKLRLLDEKKPN